MTAGRAIVDALVAEGVRTNVDTTRDLPGMIELVERTEAQERFYTQIYEASAAWDGRDLIRYEG